VSVGGQPAGDYNGDGVVDALDYTMWRDSIGSTTNLAADGDGNGVVDGSDYTIWKNHFGETTGTGSGGLGSGQVPEPSTLGMMLVALAFGGLRQRWRRIC
jgi:dockerin type I repeat protein/PEP-CTERM motif-containing protein